jgi:hypothetical protein
MTNKSRPSFDLKNPRPYYQVPAAVTYRCEVVSDWWPSSFIKLSTLISVRCGDQLPPRDRASPLLRIGEKFPGLHAEETGKGIEVIGSDPAYQ